MNAPMLTNLPRTPESDAFTFARIVRAMFGDGPDGNGVKVMLSCWSIAYEPGLTRETLLAVAAFVRAEPMRAKLPPLTRDSQ